VRGHFVGIKILGDGELKHGLTVEADKVSAGAREKIEKAGGTITWRDRRASKAMAADADVDLPTEKTPRKPAAGKRSAKKTPAKGKSQAREKTSREG
jgi:hypothetical protein